jgi:predicted GIY-YIG superfamily endonuclease
VTKHINEDAAYSIKMQQYFKGDPQGYLAYCYDQKLAQGITPTKEERIARHNENKAIESALCWRVGNVEF